MIDLTAIVLATFAGLSLIALSWIWGFWDAKARSDAHSRREAIREVERTRSAISTPRQRARAALAELQRRERMRKP